MVTNAVLIIMDEAPCLNELNCKSLIAPTQIQIAIISRSIQFSKIIVKIAKMVATKKLRISQILRVNDLILIYFLRGLNKKNTSSAQINVKNQPITIPMYISIILAFLNYYPA